jgi:enoyl-CoA hydratase/carnithine racemase
MEMLLLGDAVSARRAEQIGLVNAVVADGEAVNAALAMAERIAAKSSATVAIGKEAFYRQLEMPLAEAYDHASRVMTQNMLSADAQEGIGAFLDKRQPHWTHEP